VCRNWMWRHCLHVYFELNPEREMPYALLKGSFPLDEKKAQGTTGQKWEWLGFKLCGLKAALSNNFAVSGGLGGRSTPGGGRPYVAHRGDSPGGGGSVILRICRQEKGRRLALGKKKLIPLHATIS